MQAGVCWGFFSTAPTRHLFVRFGLGSLGLPGFLDVLGRQPPHGGLVLVVRPQLGGLTLAVQPGPQVPVGTVVVEVAVHQEMPMTREAPVNRHGSKLKDQKQRWDSLGA